jgi:hypothetical protein
MFKHGNPFVLVVAQRNRIETVSIRSSGKPLGAAISGKHLRCHGRFPAFSMRFQPNLRICAGEVGPDWRLPLAHRANLARIGGWNKTLHPHNCLSNERY